MADSAVCGEFYC